MLAIRGFARTIISKSFFAFDNFVSEGHLFLYLMCSLSILLNLTVFLLADDEDDGNHSSMIRRDYGNMPSLDNSQAKPVPEHPN